MDVVLDNGQVVSANVIFYFRACLILRFACLYNASAVEGELGPWL